MKAIRIAMHKFLEQVEAAVIIAKVKYPCDQFNVF